MIAEPTDPVRRLQRHQTNCLAVMAIAVIAVISQWRFAMSAVLVGFTLLLAVFLHDIRLEMREVKSKRLVPLDQARRRDGRQ